MCCSTSVNPLIKEIARTILVIGQFKPTMWENGKEKIEAYGVKWERFIEEENITVVANLSGEDFQISLHPSISLYNQHLGKRISASVYFEIAAKYAEKVDGEIIQKATVPGCRPASGTGILLASYPSMPMQWENICDGFRHELLSQRMI